MSIESVDRAFHIRRVAIHRPWGISVFKGGGQRKNPGKEAESRGGGKQRQQDKVSGKSPFLVRSDKEERSRKIKLNSVLLSLAEEGRHGFR